MKIEDIRARVNDLITLAGNVLATQHRGNDADLLNTEAFAEFRTLSLSFLERVFGKEHPFYRDFDRQVKDISRYMTEQGRGILKGAKQEIEGGWLFTVKGLVSAEIFSNFLDMAEYLLQEGYKDPAAVMTGSVLEEHLRQLCGKEEIPVEVDKGGRLSPKKADLLNADLANAGTYNKLDQKAITTWLDLRNKAAHGKYSEYTKEQVDLMYQGVCNFIARTSL